MWKGLSYSVVALTAVLGGCKSSPEVRSPQALFSYERKAPGVRELGVEARARAALLYVRWLGEEKSDRTEFLDEAVELAKRGAVSLLIDTPWSAPHWFETRTCQTDYESSL